MLCSMPETGVYDFELSIKVHTISESINFPIRITETGLTQQ
ncbi:hypothetical protein FB99_39050 (plasmid) [Pantoea agglomerans]|nr:hypothetical protein FB99_39050 [Pantoea agglomerans]